MDRPTFAPGLRGRRRTPWKILRGGRRSGDPGLADDPQRIGKSDDVRINIQQDHELRYWSEKFGVSHDELRTAVARAGPLVRNVRDHLQHRG